MAKLLTVVALFIACIDPAPPLERSTDQASTASTDPAACFCRFIPDCGAVGCPLEPSGSPVQFTECEDTGPNTICYCGSPLLPCGLHSELQFCTCAH